MSKRCSSEPARAALSLRESANPMDGHVHVNSVRGTSITHLFQEQVERTSDDVAIISGERQLTYRELNQKANQLAHYLRRRGVSLETPVGVFMERSIELIVALLATLKSGGAYVPLDPNLPGERLAYVLEDSGTKVLLTDSRSIAQVPLPSLGTIYLDKDADLIATESAELDLDPENLAYVIYTSGSTGNPKGVALPHRVFMRCSFWAREVFRFTSADRFLLKSTRSPEELLYPLFIGAPVVVAPPDAERDPGLFVETITKNDITVISLSPVFLSLVLAEPDLGLCQSLKHVLCSGEILPNELRKRFLARCNATLYNFYGLAEAPYTAMWRCPANGDHDHVPIGKPVDARIYLLNSDLQPVPAGDTGEVYIGGPGLARGYLNMPELTSARFICGRPPNNGPIYKTGDLAYYNKEGALVVLGRADFQMKVRGFRVEPG